jgi:hypothetical protein
MPFYQYMFLSDEEKLASFFSNLFYNWYFLHVDTLVLAKEGVHFTSINYVYRSIFFHILIKNTVSKVNKVKIW